MHSLPLLGERRFTNSNPMKSNPSVSFVIRVLSRLIVSPIRNAIPSNACRACVASLRQTKIPSSAYTEIRRSEFAVAFQHPGGYEHGTDRVRDWEVVAGGWISGPHT